MKTLVTSRSIFLRMGNVSDKQRQTKHAVYIQHFFFLANRAVYKEEKYCRVGQATDDNTAQVHCMLDT